MPNVDYVNIPSSDDNNGYTSPVSQPKSIYKENTSFVKKMDDQNTSINTIGNSVNVEMIKSNPFNELTGAYHSAGIFSQDEIDIYNKRYRYGLYNPAESIGTVKEYLFFTKPDLNIYPRDDDNGIPSTQLAERLAVKPFWLDLASRYMGVIKSLQSSLPNDDGSRCPINWLLSNMVQNNMEVPSLTAEMIETPTNMFGVGYTYRGSSEAGNDTYNFSLEFRDTKWLPVYNFFKAYESYETLKHHGVLRVYDYYRYEKVLYDQYAIYKIMVDDDGETILYCGKAFGVKSKSLPRDTFSNTDFNNGLSYSVDFEAAFFDDEIDVMYQFNNLVRDYYNSLPYQVDVHNHILDRPDNRAVKCAYIAGLPGDTNYVGYDPTVFKGRASSRAPGGRVFKLLWRGDDKV